MLKNDNAFTSVSQKTANVNMRKAMEEYTNELLAESRVEGEKNKATEKAKHMLKRGKATLEEVAEDCELSLAEVKDLAALFFLIYDILSEKSLYCINKGIFSRVASIPCYTCCTCRLIKVCL